MLEKIFPFISWFRLFNRKTIQYDVVSGLTVALVLIPQSMAYAQLAGLPVYYGLYASFLPPLVAALFGSSRQLATGPVAVVSLMTSASLEPLATAGCEGYIQYAILLAFMVGSFQFLLGVLRLGIVINFMSHPVVNGFTNAAAIIIASSQLSKLFGVSVDNTEHHYETIIRVVEAAVHYTHWPTFLLGMFAFVIMYALKKTVPRVPNVLVAVAVITTISYWIHFERNETVEITQIRDDACGDLLKRFNETIGRRTDLIDERMEVTKELEELTQSGSGFEVLKTKHQIDIINHLIQEVKYKEFELRRDLRECLFYRVPGDDGQMLFIKKDDLDPPGKDKTVWRLKVGNCAIEMDSVEMIGGGEVVASIPKGLPALSIPKVDTSIMFHLFSYAAIISLLGFMEAISIAKAMAAKTGQRLNPNQELIGQGLANVLGSLTRSYPTSGSFSRSAVNIQSGAVTGLSSVFTSLTVVVVLMFFTPLLYHLPQSVLAAVIMMAVIGLVNVTGFIHAWQAQWYDGLISIITFISTLAFAPHLDRGILLGVALSLGVFLYKSMKPTVPSLSGYEDSSLRDTEMYGLRECIYVDMIRFDSPLFFANASYLEEKISQRIKKKKKLKQIVLVCNGINDIDATGQEVMSLLIDNVRSRGIDISLSGINGSVMNVLERTHLVEKIGKDHIYPTMEKAILDVHSKTHHEGGEEQCPLTTFCRHTIDDSERR